MSIYSRILLGRGNGCPPHHFCLWARIAAINRLA
jgi:hypothetical protein